MVATRTMIPYAAVLAAALTLSACSGGDPAPSNTAAARTAVSTSSGTTTSRAPSTSPTSTKVEDPVLAKIPKKARAKTQKGAEAFATYFLTTVSEAAQQADPSPLIGLSGEECRTCAAMLDSIAVLKRAGHHHAGATLRVTGTDSILLEGRQAVVKVQATQLAADIVDRSGKKVGRTQADKGVFVATMTYDGDRWLIRKLQTMAS